MPLAVGHMGSNPEHLHAFSFKLHQTAPDCTRPPLTTLVPRFHRQPTQRRQPAQVDADLGPVETETYAQRCAQVPVAQRNQQQAVHAAVFEGGGVLTQV